MIHQMPPLGMHAAIHSYSRLMYSETVPVAIVFVDEVLDAVAADLIPRLDAGGAGLRPAAM